VLLAAACAAALAACGSSGKPGASTSGADPALRFAQCMRAHGVSNFPDPTPGRALQITPSSGIDPQAPAFEAAQQSCQRFLPNKGTPPRMSASQRRAALKFAECMRANGQPDFPDPTLTAPSGAARVLVMRGMVFALGAGVDPKSPGFRQAASRCGVTPPGGAPVPK
jgi:hypothetical protein